MDKIFLFGNIFMRELSFVMSYPILNKVYHPQLLPVVNPKGTIVIVQSWFQENPYHIRWSRYLESKGFSVNLIEFSNMKEDFSDSAKKLHEYIRNHRLTNFTLVGVSNAGLLCLEYLQTYQSWGNIKKFISVASPFKGTSFAFFISYTKKGRLMIPSSDFLKKLLGKPIPKEKMVTLSAAVDEIVPRKSSVLPGVPSITLPAIGHNIFHLDFQQTYDEIARIAEEAN